ncbi:hypothetical protein B0H14DRAFT_3135881 [Mycena olivaceomarginata]|nr:hypothetical protein B0H14DRAFT_3135881 [Mycena olivaceomarginata]
MLTLVRDGNSRFNTADSITTTVWHSAPSSLTAFWLLSQPETGGDTLPRTQRLTACAPSAAGWFGGNPLRRVHPVVRRHPGTGEEVLYVNNQMTRPIVGMKREESDLLLNFLYDHVAMSTDHQDNRVTRSSPSLIFWSSHTATSDYAHLKARRHGARISAQAERPIPALDGLKMDD